MTKTGTDTKAEYRITFTARMASGPFRSQSINRNFTTIVEACSERQAAATARAKITELYGDRAYRLTSASNA